VVCLAQFMIVLDTSIVNVALPSIQRDLKFSQADLTWVVNAYMITFGSFLLMAGRLGDLIGRKRVFLSGLVIFIAASTVCGLAQDQAVLIGARFVQGFGGAIASSVIIAMIVTEFRRAADRASAMSVYMFVVTAGGSAGLLAGGLLTQSISWHWIFFVNLPIGLAAFLLGSALINENEGLGLGGGIDGLGSVLVTLAMMVGIYAIVTTTEYGWGSAHTLGFAAASLALLVAFFALEARLANPIMPLRILRLRSLTASSGVRAILGAGMFSSFFLGVLYVQHVLGYDAIEAGLAFLPTTMGVGAMSSGVAARLVRRFGQKQVLFSGLVATIASLLIQSRVAEHTAYFPTLFTAYLLLGAGIGAAFLPLLTIATSEVPESDAGLASGIVNVSLWIAGALGLAVFGAVSTARSDALSAGGDSLHSALVGGYHLAFLLAAACVAIGVLVAAVALPSTEGAGGEAVAERLKDEVEVEAQAA
jgi:EmrB/QacA subfamily drug resistance transporter